MNRKETTGDRKKASLGKAVGTAVLRERRLRRNVLFGLTLLTLLLVFGGVTVLGDGLMGKPLAFLIFWAICFLMVGLVLLVALYDLMAVRREHRQRLRELDRQIAAAEAEARKVEALRIDPKSGPE